MKAPIVEIVEAIANAIDESAADLERQDTSNNPMSPIQQEANWCAADGMRRTANAVRLALLGTEK